MKMKTTLSDSFFAAYGLWHVVGALAFFNKAFGLVYFIGMAFLTLFVFLDRRSLLNEESFVAKVDSKRAFEIGEIVSIQLYFEFTNKMQEKPKKIFWLLPEHGTLDFKMRALPLLEQSVGKDLGYLVKAKAMANKIGHSRWESVTIQSISKLGIWSNVFQYKISPFEFRVHPPEGKLKEAEFSEKVSKQQIFSSGMRILLKSRAADQFHSIRKYQYPDPQKYIDAKKSAKYNQLMTRTYEEYRAHHLVLVLDTSRNLLGKLGNSDKIDYYISACLKLTESALAMGDRVSLISFSDRIHYMLKGARNAASFQPLYRGAEDFQPHLSEPDYSLLPQAINQLTSQRSIVFVLTDPSMPGIYKEISRNMFSICQKHFAVVIGLSEESRVVSRYVMGLNPDQPTREEVGRLLYSMHIEEELELLTARVNQWGGGIVRSEPGNWISMTKKAYSSLRSSLTS